MDINTRQLDIINYLIGEHDYITSAELSEIFSVSSRTIKDDLNIIDSVQDKLGISVSISKIGYSIAISDIDLFTNSEIKLSEKIDLNSSTDRIRYIISKFITNNLEIKQSVILDELHISEQTFYRDMSYIKKMLGEEGITIKKNQNNQFSIVGDEKSIRNMMSKYIDIDMFSIDSYNRILMDYRIDYADIQKLSSKMVELLHEYKRDLVGINITNLLIHIIVSVYRIRNGYVIQNIIVTNEDHSVELEIAKEITLIVNELFGVEFPDSEMIYLGYSLIGKGLNREDSKEVIEMIEDTYKDIDKNFNITFNIHDDYSNALYFHTLAMKDRIRYGVTIDESIIQMVKSKFILAYEMAVLFHHNYYSRYKINLNDVEVSYIALHFGAMIESQNYKKKLPKAIIITQERTGSALLLKNEIISKFGSQINVVGVYSPFETSLINISEISYVLSTESETFGEFCKSKILKIPTVLTGSAYKKIAKFLSDDLDLSSVFLKDLFFIERSDQNIQQVLKEKAEIFQHKKLIESAEVFYKNTLDREAFQSTHVSEKLALPHPMLANSKRSFICTILFKEGINWFNQGNVKLLFYIGINPEEKEKVKSVFGIISRISSDSLLKNRLIKSNSHDEFLRVINRYITRKEGTL